MALNDTPRLPCGRPVDQVWVDLEHPPTPHEKTCVYCQAARDSLDDLTAATQTLLTADEDNPDLQLSSSITSSVMQIARAEVRRGRRVPLDETPAESNPHVSLTISEQAIATVIRHIADTSPEHAEARHCRIEVDLTTAPTKTPDTTSHAAEVESGASSDSSSVNLAAATRLQIELTVSLPVGSPLNSAADRLRSAITDGVRDQLGLRTSRIDIVVEDLHDLT